MTNEQQEEVEYDTLRFYDRLDKKKKKLKKVKKEEVEKDEFFQKGL